MRAASGGLEGGYAKSKKFCQKLGPRSQSPLNVSFRISQKFWPGKSRKSKINTWNSGKSNFFTKTFHWEVKKSQSYKEQSHESKQKSQNPLADPHYCCSLWTRLECFCYKIPQRFAELSENWELLCPHTLIGRTERSETVYHNESLNWHL